MKLILPILIVLSLFFGVVGQARAAVSACTTQSTCKVGTVQYTCKGVLGAPGNADRDKPETPAVIENGLCGGPCEAVADCTAFTSAPFSWSAVKCTGKAGSPGTCVELPKVAQQLAEGPKTGTALLDLVDAVTNWVFAIFVVLSIIFVLLAAFQFVTGGGDAKKIEEARQKLIWAAVGVMVALLAKGVVPVVKAIVGG